MKLKYLRLHNFLSHADSTIDFDKVEPVTLIIGSNNGNLSDSNGSGKCIAMSSLVATDRGLVELKELLPQRGIGFDLQQDTFYPLKSTQITNLNREAEKASHTYYSGIQPTIKLSIKGGFDIEGTHNHKILVSDGQQVEFKRLDEIQQEFDKYEVVVPTNYGMYSDTEQALTWKDDWKTYSKNIILPETLTEDLAYFLGLLHGDGHMHAYTIGITTNDDEIVAYLQDFTTRHGLTLDVRQSKRNSLTRSCNINSKVFSRLLTTNSLVDGYALSYDKKLPSKIYLSPKHVQLAYLRGLFDTDGIVEARSLDIDLTNYPLIKSIQLLLMQLGIFSTIRKKLPPPEHREKARYQHSWTLSISSYEDRQKALELDLVSLSRKKSKLLQMQTDSKSKARYNLYRSVNLTRQFKRTISELLPLGNRTVVNEWLYLNHSNEGGSTPRSNLANMRMVCEKLDLNKVDYSQFELLRLIKDGNYVFLPIKECENTTQEVADLSVPGTHSFVANGIINHNTSMIEGILFALFERSRLSDNKNTTLDGLVRDGSDGQMSVELQFELNNCLYRITRTRDAKKNKGTCKFELFADNKWKLQTADRKLATNKDIIETIGIDYQTFSASVCFQQKEVDKFVDATSTERKAIIRNILQLDRYEDYKNTAKAKLQGFTEELKTIDSYLLAFTTNPIDVQVKEHELQDIEKKLSLYTIQRTSVQSQLEKLRKDQILFNEQIEKRESLNRQLESKRMMHKKLLTHQIDALRKQEDYTKVYENKKEEFKTVEEEYNSIKDKFLKDKAELLAEGKKASIKLKAHETSLQEATEACFSTQGQLESLKKSVEDVQNLKESNCPTCFTSITSSSKIAAVNFLHAHSQILQTKFDAESKTMNTLKVQVDEAKAHVEELKERINEYNQWIREKNHLKEKLALLSTAGREAKMMIDDQKSIIKENKSSIDQYESDSKLLEEQFKSIVVDSTRFEQLNLDIQEKNNKYEQVNALMTQASMTKGRLVTEIDSYKQALETCKQKTKLREHLTTEKFYYTQLVDMFGKEIPTLIIENSCRELEQIANEVLTSISDLSIEFITQQANKDGSMREVFEIKVKNPAWVDPKFIDNLSNGQKFRVVFAIRIALSRLLVRRRSASPIEFLFYDECFASLDDQGIEQVIDIFRYLKSDFRHQLVITHTSSLKERFGDNVMLVENTGGVSRIAV